MFVIEISLGFKQVVSPLVKCYRIMGLILVVPLTKVFWSQLQLLLSVVKTSLSFLLNKNGSIDSHQNKY